MCCVNNSDGGKSCGNGALFGDGHSTKVIRDPFLRPRFGGRAILIGRSASTTKGNPFNRPIIVKMTFRSSRVPYGAS